MGDKALRGNRLTRKDGGRTNLLEELGRVEAEPSNRNRRAEIARVHGELNRGYATGGVVRKLGRSLRDKILRRKEKSLRDKEKTFKTHGKDVPTMAAEGGRIGHKKGGKAKNGLSPAQSHYLQHGYGPHKRDKKAFGGRAGFKHGTKPDWKKGKFGKKTIAAMKKHDFPAGGPHQSLEGKKAALRHASIRAHEHKHGRDSKAEGGRIGLKKGGSDKKWIQKAVNPKHKGYCTPMTKKTCTPRRKALARTFKKKAKTGWS